jgi:cyclohexyl-isocyanide hydratase
MKIAFIIYNGMTALDFIGVYDPLTQLQTMGFMKNLQGDICSCTKKVKDRTGLPHEKHIYINKVVREIQYPDQLE